MRVVINHILSKEDKDAIENGQKHLVKEFECRILSDIEALTNTLSREDEHFFRCLSYLVSINRIEFVATISTKGGLGHDKYGIFTDEVGNKVAFIGSANFSQSALELNGETITVFTSPDDDKRITEYQNLFDQSWRNDTPHLIHIPINEVKTFLSESYPKMTVPELLDASISLRNNFDHASENPSLLSQRLLDKLELKEQEPPIPISRRAQDSD